jgi:hypothetical protein
MTLFLGGLAVEKKKKREEDKKRIFLTIQLALL